MKRFTDSHEWVEVDGDIATVGITHYAQNELGDIVYVELPEVGAAVEAGQEGAVLESTKAAADVYSPVSGTVTEVNEKLKSDSGLINKSAETDGWIFRLRLSAPSELDALLSPDDYAKLI